MVVGCPASKDAVVDLHFAGAAVHSCHALFTNFNNLHVGKLFIVIDESGLWDGNNQLVAQLKAKITEPIVVWEKKGVDAINTRNFANYILTTNEAHPVKVDPNDRRFFVLRPSDHRLGNTACFRALAAQMSAEGSAAHFYKYLESYEGDTRIIGDKNHLPMTQAKRELLEHALAPETKFVVDLLENEQKMLTVAGNWEPVEDGAFYPSKALYATYCAWWDSNGMSSPYKPSKKSKDEFQKQFLKITGLESDKRGDTRGATWTSTEGVVKKLRKDGVYYK
ncbi:hypothetical protein Ndes2526B_g06040 [Nannochloris sp. 'desiccata']|nr:hypothetical protein KSW81_007835 [Chlorella desiccata (nom. nud.)]KAH7619087.1 hypothetical protein NADE_005934 [Chlorella desiccata (nom. nud.)]